jgi:hypothetical protein
MECELPTVRSVRSRKPIKIALDITQSEHRIIDAFDLGFAALSMGHRAKNFRGSDSVDQYRLRIGDSNEG